MGSGHVTSVAGLFVPSGVDIRGSPQIRALREDLSLGADCLQNTLPSLWDSLPINPSFYDPVEVVVERTPGVMKVLFN